MTRLDALLSPPQLAQLDAHHASVEEYLVSRCMNLTDAAYQQQSDVEAAILSAVAPVTMSGIQLLQQLEGQRNLPTGCTVLDRLLGEGLMEGCVLEIAGTSASGKTQACHCIAAETARRGEGVVWIDTTNSFSANRTCDFILPGTGAGLQGSHACEGALQCISVLRVHNVHQLLAVLDELTVQLTQAQQQATARQVGCGTDPYGANRPPSRPLFTHQPTLLIIDSVSAVISPVLGHPQNTHGHTVMTAVARAVKSVAACNHLAVLMTNHMTGGRREGAGGGAGYDAQGGGEHMVPALGEAWRQQPHARIQLHMVSDPAGLRLVTLTSSSNKAAGEQGYFRITKTALIEERGG